jgi:hypothetical protein
MRVELTLRNQPRFRVMDYLVQAGGALTEAFEVAGDGWIAYLEALEPAEVGIVKVPRDRLVIEGDGPAVERVSAFMRHATRRRR